MLWTYTVLATPTYPKASWDLLRGVPGLRRGGRGVADWARPGSEPRPPPPARVRTPTPTAGRYLISFHSMKPLLSLSRVWKAWRMALSSCPEAWNFCMYSRNLR